MRITIEIDEQKLRSLSRTMLRAAQAIERESPEELDEAAAQLETEARTNALRKLPRRGGLATEVASSKFSRKRRKTGATTDLVVSASGEYDLAGIDKGIVIHPTFGHRPWVEQRVDSGWFSDSLDGIEEELTRDMDSLMRRAISFIR